MINVTLIGFGYVGSSLALLLLNNKHPLRLNIMEISEQCEGALLDLAHSMPLYPDKELHVNQEDLFHQADVVFLAAGIPNLPGESRLTTAKQNVQLAKEIFEHKIFANPPYIIVISNPVDIISQAVYQFSGLPPEQVIGTGTFLDSIRLSYYLSTISSYRANEFEAYVLGEHGSSQVPCYSMTRLKGQPLLDYPEFTAEILELVHQRTRDAASKIRETQDGTTYGVSKCAEALFDYLVGTEVHQLSISTLTNEHYRSLLKLDRDIYIGLPVIIRAGKVEIRNDIDLSAEEWKAYQKSAAILANIL